MRRPAICPMGGNTREGRAFVIPGTVGTFAHIPMGRTSFVPRLARVEVSGNSTAWDVDEANALFYLDESCLYTHKPVSYRASCKIILTVYVGCRRH